MKNIFICCFLFSSSALFAQLDKTKILSEINDEQLTSYADKLSNLFNTEHQRAIQTALNNNWDTVGLQTLDYSGRPLYYQDDNVTAAATTHTDELRTGGSLGLNLRGNGFVIGQWESGVALQTHFNLGSGSAATSSVTLIDVGSTVKDHATHVAGTLIGDGTHNANATGMAPLATIRAYNSTNDLSEMAIEAASGLLISNHSYGLIAGWNWNNTNSGWDWRGGTANYNNTGEDILFGQYHQMAKTKDSIAFMAPQYLIVQSAGNDRDDNPISGASQVRNGTSGAYTTYSSFIHPPGDRIGWDCIPPNGISKNILTVGAIDGNASNLLAGFSSLGPTDDGRIKPDVVGHGVNLLSSSNTSNTAYITKSGTSMSSPNVAGSAILLQEYFEDLHGSGNFMRSATLKALLIHTAEDLWNTGPDYGYGWGLVNAEAAAELLLNDNNNDGAFILEETHDGSIKQMGLLSTCTEDINVTMAYTDLPGAVQTVLDDPTPRLINDLDIRLVNNGSTSYPWTLDRLNPGNPATTGDNDLDNVEQIPTHPNQNLQFLQVLKEGTLTGGSQDYSLIMTNVDEVCELIFTQGTSTLTADNSYCSLGVFTSRATIPTGRNINYTNPSRIVLLPGFKATTGSDVHGYITPPCN